MVSRGVLSGGTVTVDMSNKGEFVFDVKKGGRAKSIKVLASALAGEKVTNKAF